MAPESRSTSRANHSVARHPCLSVQAQASLSWQDLPPEVEAMAGQGLDPDTGVEVEQSEVQPDEDPDIDQPLPGGGLAPRRDLTLRVACWVDLAPGSGARSAAAGRAWRPQEAEDEGSPLLDGAVGPSLNPDEPIETGQGETNPDEVPDIDQPLRQS